MALTIRRYSASQRKSHEAWEVENHSYDSVDLGPRRMLEVGDLCRIIHPDQKEAKYIKGAFRFLYRFLRDDSLVFWGGPKGHEQFCSYRPESVGVIHRSKPERPAR